MRYTYVEQQDCLEKAEGWICSRALQMRKDGQEQKLPVMIHKMHANCNDLELLVSRCHDEARRTLFKVSNLPEASLSTSCLVDYFKEPRGTGYAYCIATSGWHGKTLNDLFGSGKGAWKKYGTDFRERLKEPSQRRLFWQAFTPIAQLLRRLQEAKMFLPELDLDSLCFLAETPEEFQEQEDGHFSPDSLRLVGLERLVPFGVRLRSGQGDVPTTLSTPPVQILTWRSLAGVIIDTFFGAPPPAWTDERKYEHRHSAINEKIRSNLLSSEEHTLLSNMLHARDDFALGNIFAKFERLCYSLPAKTDSAGQGLNLTVVYSSTSKIPQLVDGDDFGGSATTTQVNAYLEQKLAGATVWVNPDELRTNSQLTLYFECGPSLWFRGAAWRVKDTEQYNTSNIFLYSPAPPLAPYKKENLSPVGLQNTRLRCFALHQKQHQSHNGADWVPMLKGRISYARQEKIRDKQLAILSTLEMTNQLESLMAFLNLFVCSVEEVKSESDKVTISLRPLNDEALPNAPLDCMERLTKIRKVQDDIRDIIGQTGTYSDQMFRYLLEQHEQHTGVPEHRRRHEDLLITDWKTAGSLSVTIGGGSKKLDAISWRVSNWEAIQEQGRILVSRAAPLSVQERNVIYAGKLVSVRTRGYYGQMEVIKRRTDAFEHLGKYEMLMQQLVEPARKTGNDSTLNDGQFCSRTEETLYQNVPEDRKLDDNKMAIIQDARNTLPLFVLQGPPGTGKSETVCALSKLLFNEDPMVQILMTSRENATVKELLAKLHAESRNWPSMPIFRLSRKIQDSLLGTGSNTDEDEQSGYRAYLSSQGECHLAQYPNTGRFLPTGKRQAGLEPRRSQADQPASSAMPGLRGQAQSSHIDPLPQTGSRAC